MEINVGRDVLVVAGTLRATGNFYTNLQLFHVKNSAGGIFCVLGGNLIITGLALNTITGANAQFGTGLQTYVGTSFEARALFLSVYSITINVHICPSTHVHRRRQLHHDWRKSFHRFRGACAWRVWPLLRQ